LSLEARYFLIKHERIRLRHRGSGRWIDLSVQLGTKAGYVTGVGAAAKAASPDLADVRYYKVRRDYFFMTDAELTLDAKTRYEHAKAEEVTAGEIQAIKADYDNDWKNWPVDKGAPYLERNGKPGYQKPPAFGTISRLIASLQATMMSPELRPHDTGRSGDVDRLQRSRQGSVPAV